MTPGPVLERIPFVLAVAFGTAKSPAVCAAIRGRLVHGLVTHASLARAMLGTAALLGHLAAVGFDGAPLVHRYHLAAASFDPSGYQWPRPVPAVFRTGLISHNDVHPANLVFRGGRAVALIDFDLAGPGGAAWDFAAAARLWAPLQDDQDITDSRGGRAVERFRIFLLASGLDRDGRRRVAEAVVANHDWTYAIVTEAAAAGHQGFADHWRLIAATAARARLWCQRYQRDLMTAAR